MKPKSGQCADCSKPIRRDNYRCWTCYVVHRKAQAGTKFYLCARCGGRRSRTADTEHCMRCSHEVRREKYLEQCRDTRENYDFLRAKGLSNHQVMQRLMVITGKARPTIHRQLSETKPAKGAAA